MNRGFCSFFNLENQGVEETDVGGRKGENVFLGYPSLIIQASRKTLVKALQDEGEEHMQKSTYMAGSNVLLW
jgi:hypothetical protein